MEEIKNGIYRITYYRSNLQTRSRAVELPQSGGDGPSRRDTDITKERQEGEGGHSGHPSS